MGDLLMYGLLIGAAVIGGKIGNKWMANAVMLGSFVVGAVFAYNESYIQRLASVSFLQGVLLVAAAGALALLAFIVIKDLWKDHRADTPAILSSFFLPSAFRLGWDTLSALIIANVGPALNQMLGTLG